MTPEQAPRLKGWSNMTDVADTLGVSRQTVNQMVRNGEFKSLARIGSDERKPYFVVKTTELDKVKESRIFPRSPGHVESGQV